MPLSRRGRPDGRASSLADIRELALRYLTRRMRSRRELADYLRRRGATGEQAESVLDEIERLGHLDDAAFSRAFTRDRVRFTPRGYRLIEMELCAKGVDRGIAARVVAEVEEETPEPEVALRYLSRRRRRLESVDEDEVERLVRGWLRQRGFRADTAREAIAALKRGEW